MLALSIDNETPDPIKECYLCGEERPVNKDSICEECVENTCVKCGEEHDGRAGNLCKDCNPN